MIFNLIAAGNAGLDTAAMAVVAIGLAVMIGVALWAGRVERDTRDFFLGGRSIPAWAVCLSFIATEVSALTIVAVPAEAYKTDWSYLQMFVGSAAARVAVAFLFIPVFYKYDCTTIYEFLRHRFGPATHHTAGLFFFVTRVLASGLRLYVAAMASAIMLGWYAPGGDDHRGIFAAVAAFTFVGIVFIGVGGIKAVVWSNVVQAVVFVVGGLAIAAFLIQHIDGGASAALEAARAQGRLRVFDWSLDASNARMFWLMATNGFLVSLTVFGTDQDLMQRLLTVRTRASSQRSLLATILVGLPMAMLFLTIGTLLSVFYAQAGAPPAASNPDEVFPHFAATVLPDLLKGVFLLSVLMASIDSPLGSLASSFVTDLYRPLINPRANERHYLRVSRGSVVVFGVILACVAVVFSRLEGLLWWAFKILSVTGGSLLGVFLLGLLTRRCGDRGNVWAMLASAIMNAALLIYMETTQPDWAWTGLILLGTVVTFTLGYLLGENRTNRSVDVSAT